MLLEAKQLKLEYGERQVLDIPQLQVEDWQRIGLVGINGVGKSTLLDVLAGVREPDEGIVRRYGSISYARQLEDPKPETVVRDGLAGSLLRAPQDFHDGLSGGERTRLRLAAALGEKAALLLCDEPTSNLDMDGVEQLEAQLVAWPGAIVLISHDRALLDAVCTTIWELDAGELIVYDGNWTAYLQQREASHTRQAFEYDRYQSERARLERSIREKGAHAGKMRKTPKRMGNSEARLHKRSVTGVQGKLYRAMHALETRLEKLEIRDRPADEPDIRMDFSKTEPPTAKLVASCENFRLEVGDPPRLLAKDMTLYLPNGSRTACIGGNGTGKTTLLRILYKVWNGTQETATDCGMFRVAPKVRLGWFSQIPEEAAPDMTILQRVMEISVQQESVVRTVLARLLFRRDEVHKKIRVLSGGERVKVELARILMSDANVLVLDEPTNYLDVHAVEALQEMLVHYEGTLLLVSHDRRFVQAIADRLWVFEEGKVQTIEGGWDVFMARESALEADLPSLPDLRYNEGGQTTERAERTESSPDASHPLVE